MILNFDGQLLTLTKKLGEGAHGAVFLAEDSEGKKICVKSERSKERALKESRTINSYYNNFASKVIEVNGVHYFQQPFFPGKTLKDSMRDGLTTIEKLVIAEKLKEALNKLHEKGILHRDLKADNIMVNITQKNGMMNVEVNIIDLGRSVLLNDSNNLKLRTNKLKLHFQPQVAPEFLNGGAIGKHSDVYSFGVIFKQLFPEAKNIMGLLDKEFNKNRLNAYETLKYRLKELFSDKKINLLLECHNEMIKLNVNDKQRDKISDLIKKVEAAEYDKPNTIKELQASYEAMQKNVNPTQSNSFVDAIIVILELFGVTNSLKARYKELISEQNSFTSNLASENLNKMG